MNMKQLCAKEALKYIKDGMCIGLGGGSTIGYLAEYLAKEERKITVVTPSDDTAELCKNLGLMVLSLEMTAHINIAFDGCDELDKELNALKANGAIHTKEKIKSVYLIATRDLSNLWLQFFLSQNQGFMRLFEKTVLK